MQLSTSNKYPQVYGLATQGDETSGDFWGLRLPNKASIPKLKCETLEIMVVLSFCIVLSCNL